MEFVQAIIEREIDCRVDLFDRQLQQVFAHTNGFTNHMLAFCLQSNKYD
jgi:hypothetical protein